MIDFYKKHIQNIKSSTDGWFVAQCPFHDDDRASFTFESKWGNWSCHAGCGKGTVKQFAEKLGVPVPTNPNGKKKPFPKPEAIYTYCDEKGELLFQAVRLPGKEFVQRRPGKNGNIYIK